MADAPAFEATELTASLTVKDVAASVAWYRDVIGFTPGDEYRPQGTLIAAQLLAGAVRILVTQDDGKRGERAKGEGFSLQLTTAHDVRALAERIKAAGATLDAEPFEAWGQRTLRLRDPDGFRLAISQRL